MAKQTINLGTVAGDGTGTKLRLGGDMINDNFDELYAAEALNSAKVTNATHTGDATGSGALTLATVNANVGTFNNATITVNGKGLITAAANGVGSAQFLTTNYRIEERAGVLYIDRIVPGSVDGFSGVESADYGVTGDWYNVAEF